MRQNPSCVETHNVLLIDKRNEVPARSVWKRDLGKPATTKVSVVGNSLYLGNSTKKLFRISADDGQIQNELPMPASRRSHSSSRRLRSLYFSGRSPKSGRIPGQHGFQFVSCPLETEVRSCVVLRMAAYLARPAASGQLSRRVRCASNLRRGTPMVGQAKGVPP